MIVIKDYNGNIIGQMSEQDAIQRVARMSKQPQKITLDIALNVLNALSSVNTYEISMEGNDAGQKQG